MVDVNEIIKELQKINPVIYEKTTSAAGNNLDYYIEVKRSYGYPVILKLYAQYILEQLGKDIDKFTCVAGHGNGGVPLATAISLLSGLKLVIIRDKPKNHGRKTLIDGYENELGKDDNVLVVDDVVTTGGSIKDKIIPVIESTGAKIGGIFVVCKRSEFEKPLINGIEVNYILTAKDLLK